ncbi:MAG: FlgD immunoglobulin-like domain containing protein [Candidatus Hydrothermales bacterium]
MRKFFLILVLFNFYLFATITSFTVTPSNFTVGDYVTISITADRDGAISFFLANSTNLIYPNTGNIIGGVYQGLHRILKAGIDSIYVAGTPGNAYSNPFTSNPKPPSRVIILFNNQLHLPGDSINKGRSSISLPIFPVGERIKFNVKLTDIFYNESPYSDTLNINIITDDPYATITDSVYFLPGETTKDVEVIFKRATIPYQFSPNDRRVLYGLVSVSNFKGDTARYNINSPFFHVKSGDYSKLLILEYWDSSGVIQGEIFDPGNESVGKISKFKPHPSGLNFWLEALACDRYFNRVTENNLKVFLNFDTPLPQGSTVYPETVNLRDGRDTFTLNIVSSGLYSCYLNDKVFNIKSSGELIDIRGNFYNITVDPDTILSCTQLFRFILRYYDVSGNQTNSNHKVFLSPVIASNRNQRSKGYLSDTAFNLTQGILDVYLRYCTSAPFEEISIKVTDEIGTYPFFSEPIFVNSFSVGGDTFSVYPNPFGNVKYTGVKYDMLNIEFYLPEPSDVEISIYDLFGHPVKKHRIPSLSPGKHKLTWDGRNDLGKKVSSGSYILILNAVKGARTVYKKIKSISVIW